MAAIEPVTQNIHKRTNFFLLTTYYILIKGSVVSCAFVTNNLHSQILLAAQFKNVLGEKSGFSKVFQYFK